MTAEGLCRGCERRCACPCGCRGHSHMRRCVACGAEGHDSSKRFLAAGASDAEVDAFVAALRGDADN